MHLDVEKFVGGLHDYLAKAFAPIVKRLETLEARQPEKGEKGDDGTQGEPGAPGEPGKSVTLADIEPLLKSMQAEWALDFERRAQDLFQKAIDAIPKPKDGKDGKDGADGIGWDDMTVEHDGKRTVTLKWVKGETETSADIIFPVPLDAGFYKEGMPVQQGDGVTFGGSYWIAQKDTTTKPEIGNPDWRLAVKKGRDAR